MTLFLVLDVSMLAHRAFHTTGGLTFEGEGTGVLFGVFRDVRNFCELHGTEQVAFCFDGGYSGRTVIFPEYKQSRRRADMTEEEKQARAELRRQIALLRERHLPAAGFLNVFWQDGFEADDVIASVCQNLLDGQEVVIVSSDNDLLQLLDERVTIWNPITKRATTAASFRERWVIEPRQWAMVKAIAGCPGDGVPGVPGVGELTAVKYIRGEMKAGKRAGDIANFLHKRRNVMLTRLPFPGTRPLRLIEQTVEPARWNRVMELMGAKSLMRR